MIRRYLMLTISMLTIFWTLSALAQGRGRGRGPMRPPQEAVDACEGQAEGDSCSFTFESPRGTRSMEGTCVQGPDEDKPLACRPTGRRGRNRR